MLVMIHADRVYGALRRFGLDPSAADEVAQEVFLRAWRGLRRFEERSSFSTWLYRIAYNEAQRRLARRTLPRAEPDPEREDPIAALPAAPGLGPEAQSLDREFDRVLDQALDQLPPDWRAAVVLRDIEGLSTREVAKLLGVEEVTVRSQISVARVKLAKYVRKHS